jgi:asparagine synthase (glutamine-hydrolysing)
MDALFGLVSLTDAPLSVDCARACEAFAAAEQGRVTRWSDGSARLVCAARASRPDTSASGRIARSPSGRYRVALAGALHYRADLARQLDLPSSDAEILETGHATLASHAWEKWQDSAPARLEGEFCLAVVDVHDRSVTLVQSRIEYAPLYYVETKACLGFSTRLLPLTLVPGVGRELDAAGFARAVSRYQIQANDPRRTSVRRVERLPAARARRRGRTANRDWEYWAPDPDAVTPYRTEEEVHLEIRTRLRAAVAERSRPEPMVACLLSGGLDSSSLACLAAREMNDRRAVIGVAAVLPDGPVSAVEADEPDERPHIECVQRHAGIDVALVTPAADVNPWLVPDRFLEACESPTPSPRHYLYDALFALAAGRGAGVVLDGAYGELGPSFAASMRPLDRVLRGDIRGVALGIRAATRRLISRSHRGGGQTGTLVYPACTPWLNASVRDEVLRDLGLTSEMTDPSGPPRAPQDRDLHARIGYPSLWRKVARSHIGARRWGLEVTCPFRDPRLWQYCAGLPSGLAWRRGYNRHLVRAAMDGILPPAIQWRTTKGAFSSDYYARMRRGARWARALSASLTPGETAAQLIDVAWMRSTLTTISPADICHSNIDLVFLLQGTAMAIQYLRWFDGTGTSDGTGTFDGIGEFDGTGKQA